MLAVVELRSNTMKLGVHAQELEAALALADSAWVFDANEIMQETAGAPRFDDIDELLRAVQDAARTGDTVVVMSNGGFGGFAQRLVELLQSSDVGEPD